MPSAGFSLFFLFFSIQVCVGENEGETMKGEDTDSELNQGTKIQFNKVKNKKKYVF